MYSTGMQQMESKLKGLGANYCFEKGHQIGEVYALAEKLKKIVEGEIISEEN